MSSCYNSELPIGPPGPTGPQGIQGLQGVDGTAWLNGAGIPAPELGVYNDYYLNTTNGDLYVKNYSGLALQWQLTANIFGTPGAPGLNGENGVALQWIPLGSGFFKSLGISDWITLDSVEPDTSFYSSLFPFLGSDLCPEDNSVVRINLLYEADNEIGGATPLTQASIFYSLIISTDTTNTGVDYGPLPSAHYNNTNPSTNSTTESVFTRVTYTIRRKTINTAEVFTEWSASRPDGFNLYNAQGQFYTPTFLTSGTIDFSPSEYIIFKFFPTIIDSIDPTTNPRARAISFYIEKLA